jgi:hypothetical protein
MAVVNPVTVGVAVRTVGAAWNIITSGGGLNREQRAAIEAAQQAGYSVGVRGYRDPQGRVVSQKEVLRAGRAAQIALPDAPPAARPADPGYRPDLTEKRIPPLKRPPPAPRPPTARIPKIPGRFGRIIEGIVTVGGGILGSEAILRQIPPPAPKQPPPPPVNAAPPGASVPEIGYRPPFVAPPAPKQPPPPPVAQIPAAPLPAPAPPAPIDTDRLGPLDVYTPYASIPAAPAPTGTVTPAPRTVLGLSPAQLAGLAVPTLLALLAGSSSGGRRRRDPLTQPQPLAPGGPTLGLPFVPGLPGSGLTPGGYPIPSPWPGGGGLSFGPGGSRTGECECPPKRKRKPKQAREVCYSGTFIERASGLSKTRKRKVPCR